MKAQITALVALAVSRPLPHPQSNGCKPPRGRVPKSNPSFGRTVRVILQYPAAWSSAGLLYERAVANSDVCLGNGFGEQSYVPSRDKRNCAIWICASSTDLRP